MKIYQISGLGANEKVFKNLSLSKDLEIINLPWLQPEKDESLEHYAERMAEKINPNEDFLLMGVSFGGIITKEINRFLDPKFNFLISTIKNRSEMPSYMKFSSVSHVHKIIPPQFFTSDTILSYSVFRKLYKTRIADLDEVFEFRDPYYLKWSMDRIVNWQNEEELSNFVHYHGDKDILFPHSKIQDAEIIKGGSHVLIMRRGKKLSELINKKLLEI